MTGSVSGADRVIAPRDCPDMPTLRDQIDRVDRALIGILVERLGYISRAAEIKKSRDAVRDEARVADVIAKVRREAAKRGYPEAIAERVWRELIEASIAYEFGAFDAKA